MGGLLYKDFVSISGKKIVMIFLVLTAAYIGFRIAFPGWNATDDFLAKDATGEVVNLLDIFFVVFYETFIIMTLFLMNSYIGKIVSDDKKNKIMNYLGALPFEKNTYVASKYIFIVICSYVVFSLSSVWGIIGAGFSEQGMAMELIDLSSSLLLPLIGLLILSAAIELPMFILIGKEKAMLIKIGILLVIAIFCIGFAMFGDLVWFQSVVNVLKLMDWLKKHETAVLLVNVFSTVFIGIIYFMSYKITCYFVNKGGMSYE